MLVDSLTDIVLWRDVFDRRLLERTWLISGLWLGHSDMCCWCCITTCFSENWDDGRGKVLFLFYRKLEANFLEVVMSANPIFCLFSKLWIKKNIFHQSLHSGLKFKFRFWHIAAGVFHCARPWGSYDQMCPFCHIFVHRCFANWAPAVSLRRSVLTLTHLCSDKSST